jgi:hypothetical protein
MKIDRSQIVALAYLLWCAIGYTFNHSSPVWDSLYFIREHGFIIALLLLVKDKSITTFSYLLKYGIIFYKFALIIYNILLMFVSYADYHKAKEAYGFIMLFTGIIFLAVIVSKYFDFIINIYLKLKQSIYYNLIVKIVVFLFSLFLFCYALLILYYLIIT